MKYLAGWIILIVIILTLVIVAYKLAPIKWTREDSMSYVNNVVPMFGNSGDGNAQYLGLFTTRDDCETACGKQPWCYGYTWHDNNQGGYSNQCFGVKTIRDRAGGAGHLSGNKGGEGFNVGTFSNTLQRRLGAGSFSLCKVINGGGCQWEKILSTRP
jgi:hypothetical protein